MFPGKGTMAWKEVLKQEAAKHNWRRDRNVKRGQRTSKLRTDS